MIYFRVFVFSWRIDCHVIVKSGAKPVPLDRTRQATRDFGFHMKYTGTPNRTMIRPGHVVAVR